MTEQRPDHIHIHDLNDHNSANHETHLEERLPRIRDLGAFAARTLNSSQQLKQLIKELESVCCVMSSQQFTN